MINTPVSASRPTLKVTFDIVAKLVSASSRFDSVLVIDLKRMGEAAPKVYTPGLRVDPDTASRLGEINNLCRVLA